MPWHITYWRGTTPLRVTTVEDATQYEVASLLRKIAANQLDLEYLQASGKNTDGPERPEIRSNSSGTMLWTTGQHFHYTAEWFLCGASSKRKRSRSEGGLLR
jgi:hypothetical protein